MCWIVYAKLTLANNSGYKIHTDIENCKTMIDMLLMLHVKITHTHAHTHTPVTPRQKHCCTSRPL